MDEKLKRLQEIVEFGMYNINPTKKEALEIIKELNKGNI
tara:strand:- start:324 stop:440 length:117 start_codon:yes stop_codon:yes gene_type:complete